MYFHVIFGRISINNKIKPVFVLSDCDNIDEKIKSTISMLIEVNIGGFYNKFITKKFEINKEELNTLFK